MDEMVILTHIKMRPVVFELFRPLRDGHLIYLYLIEIAPCPTPVKYNIEAAPDSPYIIDPIEGVLKDSQDGEAPFIRYLDKTAVDCSKVKLIIRFTPEQELESQKSYMLTITYLKDNNDGNHEKDDGFPVNLIKMKPNPKVKMNFNKAVII